MGEDFILVRADNAIPAGYLLPKERGSPFDWRALTPLFIGFGLLLALATTYLNCK